MDDLVCIEGLSKVHYGAGLLKRRARTVRAVDDVTLTIGCNTIMGLVGESGSGKSTLARAVLYLDRPSAGSVEIDGLNPAVLSRAQMKLFRQRAQIVVQDPHAALNPRRSVAASVAEGLRNRGVPRCARERRVAELLEMVGIPARRGRDHPEQFSGGQRQRIVIARALAMDPRFLILDEPVSSLDVSIQAQIINLLLDLKHQLALTYLFISHDLNLVAYISDSIAVMKQGRIVEQGDAADVIAHPQQAYTQMLFQSAPRLFDTDPGRR
ncbi:MAG: ABC transporter ATP-binding protein [Spirochaetaceae bacterium]|nr:MAG: ABC transporter ATP-binding protein [Spirochaetaceae bacterium]